MKIPPLICYLAILLPVSCEKDEITSYEVPRDREVQRNNKLIPRQKPLDYHDSGNIKWVVPENWIPKHFDKPARYATFQTGESSEEALIAVTRFPSDVGGALANVNRWRSQVGLPSIQEKDLDRTTEKLNVGGVEVLFLDLDGPQKRLVVAMLPRENETWFVKMDGPKELLENHKKSFLAFVNSIRFVES